MEILCCKADKIFLISSSDGDRDDPLTLPSTSSAEPNTSTACTGEEEIDKLSGMFPNESRKDLENCLKFQGCVDQAVMTLLQPRTFPELSDDDSELMKSVFEQSS